MINLIKAPWLNWQHQATRDLAWVLGSPPLLMPHSQFIQWPDNAWYQTLYHDSIPFLQSIDKNPKPLYAFLAEEKDHRLGHYVESLLRYWLLWPDNPRFELVHYQVALRNQYKTVGEADFLVRDKITHELQHWEVAVKFYLAQKIGGEYSNFVGPGLNDRLDYKYQRLTQHQLQLFSSKEGQHFLKEQQLEIPSRLCFLKGRLFYPPKSHAQWWPHAGNPKHLKGLYGTSSDIKVYFKNFSVSYCQQPQNNWLTELYSQSKNALIKSLYPLKSVQSIQTDKQLISNHQRAQSIIIQQNGVEKERAFILPTSTFLDN